MAAVYGPSRRSFLASAGGAALSALAVTERRHSAAAASAAWRPTYILSSALYGTFPLAEILQIGRAHV